MDHLGEVKDLDDLLDVHSVLVPDPLVQGFVEVGVVGQPLPPLSDLEVRLTTLLLSLGVPGHLQAPSRLLLPLPGLLL